MAIGYKNSNGDIVSIQNIGQTIQVATMPTASASNVDFIYQYIGATTQDYINGFFYKCISDGLLPATYSWVNIDVQNSSGGQTIQVDTLPVASATELGNIYQFVGTSTSTLTNGYFYRCVSDGATPPVYLWEEVEQPPLYPIWTGTRAEHTAAEQAGEIPDNALIGITDESGGKTTINTVPSQDGTLTYNGTEQTPSWENYDSEQLTLTGTTAGTNAGTYTVTFTPKVGYQWDDQTTIGKNVTWRINGVQILTVPMQSGTLTYTGSEQTPTWTGYNTDELTISGDTAGTAAGTYTATFTPKTNYEWYDGTTTGKNADWSIGDVVITTIPSQSGTITYDGTEKTASWSNFDSSQLTVTGDTATNAGTYTASFTPKAGYKWSDNTTTAKTAEWVIDKAEGNATLSTNAVTLDSSHTSVTVMVTNATGDVGVTSGDPTLATASYSNGTITITSPDSEGGETTVTVTIAASSNYNGATKSITVTCNFFTIKDWKDGANKGTDAEIVSMIAAADIGTLDLSLYWAIGDKRTVNLAAIEAGDGGLNNAQPAQDIVLILMDTGLRSGYTDVNNKAVNYIVGQENCLLEYGRVNSVRSNAGSWDLCKLREDLNSKYYNALPEIFKGCLKQFKVITAASYNSSDNKISEDYVALFAEKEVIGSKIESNAVEAAALIQINYYETAANRIKQKGSENIGWAERSPFAANAQSFCMIVSDGSAATQTGQTPTGISPFMCI